MHDSHLVDDVMTSMRIRIRALANASMAKKAYLMIGQVVVMVLVVLVHQARHHPVLIPLRMTMVVQRTVKTLVVSMYMMKR
jgi:hypothetical protein